MGFETVGRCSWSALTLMILTSLSSACGTRSDPTATAATPASSQFGHVFLVVVENHSFSEVISHPAMPFLNSLSSSYGLATQYYANTHPSRGNYFRLSGGQIISSSAVAGSITVDNIVRGLVSAGKKWNSNAESLPGVGYTGPDVYPYVQDHNPFVFFSDVLNGQTKNLVPFAQFAADLASGQLPDFSYLLPNNLDNAHDASLAQADLRLNHNLAPLLYSPLFQQDGLLIIVFDESDSTDLAHGGGQIVAVIVSRGAKRGYQSTTFLLA